MTKRKLLTVGLAAVAVVLAAGVAIYTRRGPEKTVPSAEKPQKNGLIRDVGKKDAKVRKAGKKAKSKAEKAERRKQKRQQQQKQRQEAWAKMMKGLAKERFANLSPAEKKVVDTLQQAMDDDSQPDILKSAEAAMKSSNAEVRELAVESLSWCGSKALPELTSMMADSNPDVASAAMDAVENALTEIEDPITQFRTAKSYMSTFGSNEDALTMFSGILSSSAGDVLSDDDLPRETRLDNRAVVVETLGEMIQGGGMLGEKAKDTYRDITGEDWEGVEAAAKWASTLDDDADAAEDSEELPAQ